MANHLSSDIISGTRKLINSIGTVCVYTSCLFLFVSSISFFLFYPENKNKCIKKLWIKQLFLKNILQQRFGIFPTLGKDVVLKLLVLDT